MTPQHFGLTAPVAWLCTATPQGLTFSWKGDGTSLDVLAHSNWKWASVQLRMAVPTPNSWPDQLCLKGAGVPADEVRGEVERLCQRAIEMGFLVYRHWIPMAPVES